MKVLKCKDLKRSTRLLNKQKLIKIVGDEVEKVMSRKQRPEKVASLKKQWLEHNFIKTKSPKMRKLKKIENLKMYGFEKAANLK